MAGEAADYLGRALAGAANSSIRKKRHDGKTVVTAPA